MAADYTLSAQITADAKNFVGGMKEAQNSASDFFKNTGKNIQNAGKTLVRSGATVTAMTAPLAFFAKQAFDTGKEFRTSMSTVQALSGATEKELNQLEAAARDMGKNTRFSASQAADGLGYMSLAGWDAQQSMTALPAVLNLAIAGNMDLANASDIVTDSMTAFNLQAKDSERFTDGMAYAQANSNTTVEALGEAFKQSASSAIAANQSYETTTALLGVLADAGVKGSAAGTGLNAMFRDLRASAKDGAIAVGDSSVALYDAEGNMRNVTKVLSEMESAMADMTQEQRDQVMSSIFQQQSLKAVNTLFGQGTDAIFELTEGIENSSGAASEMASIMDDNMEGSIMNLQSSISELQLRFFELTEGPIRGFIDSIGQAIDWISNLNDRTLGIVMTIGAFTLALGPALIMLGLVAQGVGILVTAFGFILSPIGLVVAAIVGLIAVFVLFREEIMAVWQQYVQPIFNQMASLVKEHLLPAFRTAFNSISSVVSTAFEIIKNVWDSLLWPVFESIMRVVKNQLMPAFQHAFPIIGDVISTVFTGISDLWSSVLQPVFNIIVTILKYTLLPAFQFAFGAIGSLVSSTFQTIGELWRNSLKPIFTGIIDFLGGVFTLDWERAWSGIVSIFSGIFGGIVAIAKAPINGVISLVNGAISGLNNISVNIPDWVPKYGGSNFGVNIPSIPMLYRGTDDFEGGFARMNEGGRGELVNLPNGTQVIPHDLSRMYAREAGRQSSETRRYDASTSQHYSGPSVVEMHLYADIDGKELSREIAKPIRIELDKIDKHDQIIRAGRKSR